MSVSEAVKKSIRSKRPGTVVSASALASLGSREAVDQALARLTRAGELIRVARGRYVRPQKGRFGSFPPPAATVVKSLAKSRKSAIVESGAVSANHLGITTQQPVRHVFMTAGKSVNLTLGKGSVEIVHVPKWQTMFANRPAGRALRALAYLGKERAVGAAQTIRSTLPPTEWQALRNAHSRLPRWVSQAVEKASEIG